MHLRPLLAAAGCLAAVLVGCSESESAPTTPLTAATIATASSTTVAASVPVTTRPSTTTTRSPTTTSSTATTTTTTSTTSTSATSTTSTTSEAATTAAPPTVAPTTAAPAAFVPVASPAVPSVTHAIDAAWADPVTKQLLSVDDGVYWGNVVGQGTSDSGDTFVTYRFVQAFFGDACTARFGADSCDNDLGTLESPTGTMPMFAGAARTTVADPTTQLSYEISNDVLLRLIADPSAAVGAPEGYLYAPFASLVEVRGGQIVRADQVWTP